MRPKAPRYCRMRRIGDRQFLFAWQVIRAATQPGPEATVWHIGEALCRRYRHSLTTPDHRVVLDVCHIEQSGVRGGWRVMVTSETWWDDRRGVLRTQLWASHTAGSRDRALAWMAAEAASREKRPEGL